MLKLPVVSGRVAIKAFQKIGYEVVRQRGSHVRLKHPHPREFLRYPLTIPLHKTLGRGLLRRLIRDANITSGDFLKLLKK